MYHEELVYRIKEQNEVEDGVLNLYLANYGLIYRFASDFRVPINDLEDFKQLCYFALLEAIRVFPKNSEYSFTACFRLCVRSAYSQYKLHSEYPVSITRWGVRKLTDSDMLPKKVTLEGVRTPYLDYYFRVIEEREVKKSLWDRVNDVLSPKNALVLRMRYLDEKTYREIGEELGIGAERARMRHNRSLRRLRDDPVISEIAILYGIYS